MTRLPFQGILQSDRRLLQPEEVRGQVPDGTWRGMVILVIRTDKPQAELYLYSVKDVKGRTFHKELGKVKWQAHLELSKTIHKKINKLLRSRDLSSQQIEGIVCFKGPGSFTGLRIGLSLANALAYANQIPIVACRGEEWLDKGIAGLLAGRNDKIAMPYYDRPAVHRPVHGPAAPSAPKK